MRNYVDSTLAELLENGCRKDIIDKFYRLSTEQDMTGLILTLTKYRQELNDRMLTDGKLIDCIDYLIYHLEKKV